MSAYFDQFPFVAWGDYRIKNIMMRVATDVKKASKVFVFDNYFISDGERADTLAHRFYNDFQKDWVVYVVNNITPSDWPMSEDEFQAFLLRKYGLENMNRPRHYVDSEGREVQRVFARSFEADGETVNYYQNGEGLGTLEGEILIGRELTPVSYAEWEREKNEAKRKIKILRPDFVGEFVSDFRIKMGIENIYAYSL